MPELSTRQQCFLVARRYALLHAKRITPEMVDVDGSDVNVYLGAISFFGQAVAFQMGQRLNALVPSGADGDDLTRVGFDRYSLEQRGAEAAFYYVTIARVAGGPIGVVSAGTLFNADGGIQFVLLQDAVFGTTTLKVENLITRAVNAGKSSQVSAGKIRQFADLKGQFDKTLTVVNPDAAIVQAQDPEAGDEFRERIYNFWNTVRRGTLPAIEFGTLLVPSITRANAEDVMTTDTITGRLKPARVVQLYAANDTGATPTDSIPQIYESLEEWRACGVAAIIRAGTPQLINIGLRLKFTLGIKIDDLVQQIIARVVVTVNALNPNATLYASTLRTLLAQYQRQGLLPDESTVAEPLGDLVPFPGRSIRVTAATVTVVIV